MFCVPVNLKKARGLPRNGSTLGKSDQPRFASPRCAVCGKCSTTLNSTSISPGSPHATPVARSRPEDGGVTHHLTPACHPSIGVRNRCLVRHDPCLVPRDG